MNEIPIQSLLHSLPDGDNIILITTIFLIIHYVGGNNTSMAENYYLLFKPLSVGDHTIELQYTRKPPGQPQAFEEGSAKWDIKVVP
jgi:hypothetical protein